MQYNTSLLSTQIALNIYNKYILYNFVYMLNREVPWTIPTIIKLDTWSTSFGFIFSP